MKINFDKFLCKFRPNISGYDYYVDFKDIIQNVEKMKIEHNILNFLINLKKIETYFATTLSNYPEILKCIPFLGADRWDKIYALDYGSFLYYFNEINYSIEQYNFFIKKNLVDFVYSIKKELDLNRRKNLDCHLRENLIKSYIQKIGFKNDALFFKEIYLSKIKELWNIELSILFYYIKIDEQFNFVIKINNRIYAIEANYYNSMPEGISY